MRARIQMMTAMFEFRPNAKSKTIKEQIIPHVFFFSFTQTLIQKATGSNVRNKTISLCRIMVKRFSIQSARSQK